MDVVFLGLFALGGFWYNRAILSCKMLRFLQDFTSSFSQHSKVFMDTNDTLSPEQHATIYAKLAHTLNIKQAQVQSFAELYDDGQSVPFIARYRKDKTGGLDDEQLRTLEKGLIVERDLAERRKKILELLHAQGNLTDALTARIHAASSKLELEEVYAPYRPRRRSLSAKAKLAGLLPVALAILEGKNPSEALKTYTPVSEVTDETGETFTVDYSTEALQLEGVGAIILDEWATELALLDKVRAGFNATASIHAFLVGEEKREVGEKFKDYFDHVEPFAKLSSHRLLAMLRGRQQNVLAIKVLGEDEPFIEMMKVELLAAASGEQAEFLASLVKRLWVEKWRPQIEHRLLTEHRLRAERDAIDIFAKNLQHLLMAAPAGQKVILGVDPGIRHGVKMAVIDETGKVLATKTVYPFAPDNKVEEARNAICELIKTHAVALVAIGNGTASRETETLVKDVIKTNALPATALVISEAGASVYSASELASHELSELDVSVRGAVSIARRLQDPLSELVKVEPKAIGVGQYQHDVNQSELETSLDNVTADCVNAVGVDVNTASPSILSHIAGLSKNVAEQIVNYRSNHGAFTSRDELKAVPRLGEKTFLQAAGFLRIKSGSEPLDRTGVHPENYELVYQLLNKNALEVKDVIGNPEKIAPLLASFSPLSVEALALNELAKAQHDPRGSFVTAKFRDDVNSVKDLVIGMELEGVVTNVTAFGCFVDVGVHQDGLVHISELSDGFVENPSDLVKPYDIVKVRVISVDEARGRIGFSMKKEASKADNAEKKSEKKFEKKPKKHEQPNQKADTLPAKKPKSKSQEKQDAKVGSLGALLQKAGL